MNQLQFDDVRSYDDWDIYLSSYEIGDAEPKENYIDIPAGDGSIDLTEALTGEVSYENRSFTATLTLKPPRSDWMALLDEIRAYLNGRVRTLIEPDDTEHYYIGRFKTSFNKDGVLGILTVTGTVEPYKYKNNPTVRNVTLQENGTSNITLKNSRKRVIPTITTSAQVTIKMGNVTRVIVAGTHRLTNIILTEGDNLLTITGTQGTTIKFEYQEGAL